jgi:hypothetical protein
MTPDLDGGSWGIPSVPGPVDMTRWASRRRMAAICALLPFIGTNLNGSNGSKPEFELTPWAARAHD